MSTRDVTSPSRALRRGRLAVDDLMMGMRLNGGMFLETTATQLLLRNAAPRVQFREFTNAEEAKCGADWLWWWIDQDGSTCFGLLAQAKILKATRGRWSVDLTYVPGNDKKAPSQLSRLLRASSIFNVPATYVLYCGDPAFRSTLVCDSSHPDGVDCKDRDRVGVSIVSALVAETALAIDQGNAGVAAFHSAVPVEDIASPDGQDAPVLPLARDLDGDLLGFLRNPQRGSKRVAKELLRPLEVIRRGQFASAAVLQRTRTSDDALFQNIPNDYGHFSQPYLAHALQGLRTSVPDYVRDVLEGRTPPSWVTDQVAGIVVITDADAPGESESPAPTASPLVPGPQDALPGLPSQAA